VRERAGAPLAPLRAPQQVEQPGQQQAEDLHCFGLF
jgi:hypothetical protein